MSLIADALKTAQREKQRRESGSAPDLISPVLVPMRAVSEPSFSWQRALTIGVSITVTVVALFVMVQRVRKTPPRPLAALPPMTSAPLNAATPSPSATRRAARDSTLARLSAAREVMPRSPYAQPSSARLRQQSRPVARGIAQAIPSAAAGAVPQGQPRSDSSAVASPPSVESAGRLRIAVEQPREAEANQLFVEALAAHRAGDVATAGALYTRVLALAPNHADALNNLGVLLSGQRDFDRALALLRRAASVAPKNAGIWNNIGTALREQRHGSDAIAAFRHALSLDPQHQGAKVGLAQQYLAIGSLAQARGLLEDVLATNPLLPEAHYALGQALERQGDRAGAIREYSEFVRLAPPSLTDYIERTRRHVDSLSTRAP